MLDTIQQTVYVSAAKDAASRAIRQAIQTLVPTLLVVVGGSVSGIDVTAVVILAAITAAISLLKTVLALRVPATAPLWARVVERAATAAAGTALSFITTDGLTPAASIPWDATLTGTLGAAALAVAMYFSNPPVVAGEITGEAVDEPAGPDEGIQFVAGEPLPARRRAEDGTL